MNILSLIVIYKMAYLQDEQVIIKIAGYKRTKLVFLEITNYLREKYYEFGEEDKSTFECKNEPILLTKEQIEVIKYIFSLYNNTITLEHSELQDFKITDKLRDIIRSSSNKC